MKPVLLYRITSLFFIGGILVGYELFLGSNPLFHPWSYLHFPSDSLMMQGFSWILVAALLGVLVFPSQLWVRLLAISIYAVVCLLDLNKFQIEFLIYASFLLVPSDSTEWSVLGVRFLLLFLYVSNGLTKLNPDFGQALHPWFWSPLLSLNKDNSITMVTAMLEAGFLILIGLTQLSKGNLFRVSVSLAIVFHCIVMIILGLFHQSLYGLVLCNLFLILILFGQLYEPGFQYEKWKWKKPVWLQLPLVLGLSSIIGFTHTHFSFQLLSTYPYKPIVLVTEPFFDKLPTYLKKGAIQVESEHAIDYSIMYASNMNYMAYPDRMNYLSNATLYTNMAAKNDMVFMIQKDRVGLGNSFLFYTVEEINAQLYKQE